jgi:protease-4
MRRAVVVVLALLGGLALLGVIVCVVVGVVALSSRGTVPRKTILEVDFEQAYDEYVPDEPLTAILSSKKPTVIEVVEALERAAGDDRVAGLVAKVGSARMGLGRLQELRDAVIAFRKSGKPPWPGARPSASSRRGTEPITWPPGSTRSTCSLPGTWGSRDCWRRAPSCAAPWTRSAWCRGWTTATSTRTR